MVERKVVESKVEKRPIEREEPPQESWKHASPPSSASALASPKRPHASRLL